MSFSRIASGSAVFVDANIFVSAFAPDLQLGPACKDLLERIELGDIQGFTSSQVLSDVAHRLMTLEACLTFGWPYAGIAARLQRHPQEIRQLTRFREAIEAISLIGVQISPVTADPVEAAAIQSQQIGLLSNDALVVAMMQDYGWTQVASHDSDFDRVPGIIRYAPTGP